MHWQRERFRVHIRAARALAKPLVIHTRSASQDTLALLDEEGEDGLSGSAGGVFHCFTESAEVARAALKRGFYISFSGIVTFKNAGVIAETAREVPAGHFMLETDAPYLPPVPYRGKRNESSYIPLIAEKLTEIYNCSLSEIAEKTSQNAIHLFQLEKFGVK
jgi:TatD DNase family protein